MRLPMSARTLMLGPETMTALERSATPAVAGTEPLAGLWGLWLVTNPYLPANRGLLLDGAGRVVAILDLSGPSTWDSWDWSAPLPPCYPASEAA